MTIGRALTDTFAGIDPTSVPPFVAAQVVGLGVAVVLIRALYPDVEVVADDVIVPHAEKQTGE